MGVDGVGWGWGGGSAVDQFKRQFAHLEEHYTKGSAPSPLERQHTSLPR